MLYVDTSVLVALCTHEAKTAATGDWYANCTEELISAAWCVTEFASALGIKQRTGQITAEQAQSAWRQFERIGANDLELLPVDTALFHHAALMTLDPTAGLRAGDALHLACAVQAKAKGMVSLDAVLMKNAKQFKIKPVPI